MRQAGAKPLTAELPQPSTPAITTRMARALLRRRGTREWDIVIRATIFVGLLAIYPVVLWPAVADLAAFLMVTMFVNGPLSPVFVATYEPIIMAMARLHPPLVVALVGTAGILYIEYMNYHLYKAAVMHRRLDAFRDRRLIRGAVALFRKSPFLAVWVCAWSPLPFWVARILAPIAGYPVKRFLLAAFLGRFPRMLFFAGLGLWLDIPTSWLLTTSVVLSLAGLAFGLQRRTRIARVRASRG